MIVRDINGNFHEIDKMNYLTDREYYKIIMKLKYYLNIV